jgi:hypothetical protein
VQSRTTTLNQIERWITRFRAESRESRIVLKVNPQLADALRVGTLSRLRRLMLKYFIYIRLEPDPSVRVGEFRCISVKQGKDITDQYQ